MSQLDGLPDLLTVPETAGLLRISKRHTYAMVKEGRVPCLKFGTTIRIPKCAVIELIHGPPGNDNAPAATAGASSEVSPVAAEQPGTP